MQREKIDNSNIDCVCVNDFIANLLIYSLLYSREFTIVNFTYSKLAKSLHLKIDTKVIKKTNTNKLNYKIMEDLINSGQFATLHNSIAIIINSITIILITKNL